jgi:uncharacterized protein YfbU (UPF0304 family)
MRLSKGSGRMPKFDLTLKERLFLANQYLILERLYPEHSEDYAKRRQIVTSGYSLDYDWIADEIDHNELTEEECREVRDILELHRALTFSAEKTGVEAEKVRFDGFDGNNETKQFGYASYILNVEGKWGELKRDGRKDFNSHSPTLSRYRLMLLEWKKMEPSLRYDLDKTQIERILNAPDTDRRSKMN